MANKDPLSIEILGEAMRPEREFHKRMRELEAERRAELDQEQGPTGHWAADAIVAGRQMREEVFRLSREERDHVAGHALDSIYGLSAELNIYVSKAKNEDASTSARKIAALSNLLGDIGWEREGLHPFDTETDKGHEVWWSLGELFPVAQLWAWLEGWQRQDDEALTEIEALAEEGKTIASVSDAQTKLGTGAILLARLEKWMACKEN